MKINFKQLLVDAIAGCKIPIERQAGLAAVGSIVFKGNQHDPYNYAWVKQRLHALPMDALEVIYEEVSE